MYDDIKINVKNHQTALTIRPDMEFGDAFADEYCCINELNANQNEFNKLNLFDILAIKCDDDGMADNDEMVIDASPVFQQTEKEKASNYIIQYEKNCRK